MLSDVTPNLKKSVISARITKDTFLTISESIKDIPQPFTYSQFRNHRSISDLNDIQFDNIKRLLSVHDGKASNINGHAFRYGDTILLSEHYDVIVHHIAKQIWD